MITLKVYEGTDQFFLDLYDSSPIKISLSIEDIVDTATASVFSKTFRVPGTNHNAEFFKSAFLVEGMDFDVTVKKRAEILVDGNEFQRGHVRLQKMYVNDPDGRLDYELLFMGETRDFASSIGDATMCNLNITDLTHTLNETSITLSWNAYPNNFNGATSNGLTGLVNGNVLYPLIDFGNTYNQDGCIQESRISVSHDHPAGCPTSNDYFTHGSAKGIEPKRFKPMIRAKKLWDQIFEDAGFTYTSDFLGTPGNNAEVGIFKQLYVSAFGNDEAITVDDSLGSADNFSATGYTYYGSSLERAEYTTEISDPNNNYNNLTSVYTAPVNGSYTFFASIDALGQSGQGTGDRNTEYFIRFRKSTNGGTTFLDIPGVSNSFCTAFGVISMSRTFTLNANDQVEVYVDDCGGGGNTPYQSLQFQCTASPAAGFNPTPFLDCEYKQIDFIKDVITTFRLVMQPNPNKERDFIIEPWFNFHAGGEVLDWSDKLVTNKDFQIEPLFYTQTDEIDFNLAEDSDWVNDYHRKVWKENYGYLEFDSGSELLKGKRDIKVNYAPTPLSVVEGTPPGSAWIIPHLHTHSPEDTGNQHLPIKAKTRFLFYNGKRYTGNTGSSVDAVTWYFENSNGYNYYPAVSPISGRAIGNPSPNNIILQWYKDVTYYFPFSGQTDWDGQSMYDVYWQSYIQSLYATFARKVTAYFTLDYLDVYDFTFDKVIFVNGVYYTVNKIIDMPVGDTAQVKVELLKVLNFAPSRVNDDETMGLALQQNVAADACNYTTTLQTVTYQGQLEVGTVLQGFGGVSGNNGFFRITTNSENVAFVGRILGVNDDDEVISIQNICP